MNKKRKGTTRQVSSFSIEERKKIVDEFLSGNDKKTDIWFKYTGRRRKHENLNRWMQQLGMEPHISPGYRLGKRINTLHQQQIPTVSKDKIEVSQEELLNRLKHLEKQLKTSRLRVEGYEIMIEIAEKELNFPIRRKSGTK